MKNTTAIEQPLFVVKYWTSDFSIGKPPVVTHAVFYHEPEMVDFLRKIKGNYFIYGISGMIQSREYYDKLFLQEKTDKELEEYKRLKRKFEDE